MPRVKMTQGDLLDAGIVWFKSLPTTNFDGLHGRAYFLPHHLTPPQRKAVIKWKNTAIRRTHIPTSHGKTAETHIIIIYDKIIPVP